MRFFSVGGLFLFVFHALAAGQSELRTFWHRRIATHRVVPYSSSSKADTSDAMAQIDAVGGNTNSVVLIYGGHTLPTATFGKAGGWNREHLWPNSYGLDNREPSFSDLHNLRPADSNVNSARGNKWFDVSNRSEGGYQAPGHAEAPDTTEDVNSWEPPLPERGDIARALFYMDLRYEGDAAAEPDLQLVENVARISSTNVLMGPVLTLVRWHLDDPPDERERTRNAAVERWQGNRNPFIDDPELVLQLYVPQLTIRHSAGQPQPEFPPLFGFSWSLESATSPLGPWTTNQLTGDSLFWRLRFP